MKYIPLFIIVALCSTGLAYLNYNYKYIIALSGLLSILYMEVIK